jgi:hypothetical protein
MRSGRNHRPRADPEQPDPYIWELYGITQCDTMLVEWEGSGAPFDV